MMEGGGRSRIWIVWCGGFGSRSVGLSTFLGRREFSVIGELLGAVGEIWGWPPVEETEKLEGGHRASTG